MSNISILEDIEAALAKGDFNTVKAGQDRLLRFTDELLGWFSATDDEAALTEDDYAY